MRYNLSANDTLQSGSASRVVSVGYRRAYRMSSRRRTTLELRVGGAAGQGRCYLSALSEIFARGAVAQAS